MRTRVLLITTALLALTLSGCGDDTEGDSNDVSGVVGPAATAPVDPDALLEQDQVDSVLLDVSDLDAGFSVRPPQANESNSFQCMGRIDDLHEFGDPPATYDESVFYGANGEPKKDNATIFHGVGSYESVEAAQQSFNELRDLMRECREVKFRAEGYRYDLLVATAETATPPADEQINLTAKGTYTYKKNGPQPYMAHYSVVRVGNEIVTLAMSTTAYDDLAGKVSDLLATSLDRLQVLNGATETGSPDADPTETDTGPAS